MVDRDSKLFNDLLIIKPLPQNLRSIDCILTALLMLSNILTILIKVEWKVSCFYDAFCWYDFIRYEKVSRSGGIGRRAAFRSQWASSSCEFESHLRHHVCARSSVDRALPCGGRGRRFESSRARHRFIRNEPRNLWTFL